ncbi:MAG: hypothetical protein LBQ45_01190 [Mycoplasmataceae bacterium]|nr:hypothetical protein [Mycoplasmataceae bacterium]
MSEEKKEPSQEIGEDIQVDFTPVPKVITKDTLDINENVGSFSKTFTKPEETKVETNLPEVIIKNEPSPAKEVEIAAAVEKKEEAKVEDKEEVNFERFNRTKTYSKSSVGKFKIGLETKLNNRKSLIKIWLIYLGVIAGLIVACALFIVFDAKNLEKGGGYNHIKDVKNCGLVGEIFAYIAVCLPAIPLFVLFIAWLIQINGTYKSPSYHLMFIVFLSISLVIFFVSLVLSSVYLSMTNHYILA